MWQIDSSKKNWTTDVGLNNLLNSIKSYPAITKKIFYHDQMSFIAGRQVWFNI